MLTSGIVEVHSDIITAPINSGGTYLLENVPVGDHEILFKDNSNNTIVEDTFTLTSNHEEGINDKTIAIEVALNSDTAEEIKTQSTLHTNDLVINHGFSNSLSYSVYDRRNKSITETPETKYSYGPNLGSTVTCTNNQIGSYANGILLISNVTSNTTCTITFTKATFTLKNTLYNDTSAFKNATTFGSSFGAVALIAKILR